MESGLDGVQEWGPFHSGSGNFWGPETEKRTQWWVILNVDPTLILCLLSLAWTILRCSLKRVEINVGYLDILCGARYLRENPAPWPMWNSMEPVGNLSLGSNRYNYHIYITRRNFNLLSIPKLCIIPIHDVFCEEHYSKWLSRQNYLIVMGIRIGVILGSSDVREDTPESLLWYWKCSVFSWVVVNAYIHFKMFILNLHSLYKLYLNSKN